MRKNYHLVPETADPDRQEALRNYRVLAKSYDDKCLHVTGVRLDAIHALALKEGDTVLDVACGTGATLPELARRAGVSGRVIGIEQSPEMAQFAQDRIQQAGISVCTGLIVTPLENLADHLDAAVMADAALMCFTQDVLQNPLALEHLFSRLKPGARIAVAGVRLQPWWYAWPVNLWALVRSKGYYTTSRGFHRPWIPLLAYCPDLTVRATYHLGLTYLACGTYSPNQIQTAKPNGLIERKTQLQL